MSRFAVALGRDHPEVICLMADEGIFYVLSVMALYPPTSGVTLASLGKLANCEGQAGWEAQVIASVRQQTSTCAACQGPDCAWVAEPMCTANMLCMQAKPTSSQSKFST